MSLRDDECIISADALDAVIKKYENTSGIRDLEQAAEHLAAHALYKIEVEHVSKVEYTPEMVNNLLG
jgi:ATP-dependent Lon protease